MESYTQPGSEMGAAIARGLPLFSRSFEPTQFEKTKPIYRISYVVCGMSCEGRLFNSNMILQNKANLSDINIDSTSYCISLCARLSPWWVQRNKATPPNFARKSETTGFAEQSQFWRGLNDCNTCLHKGLRAHASHRQAEKQSQLAVVSGNPVLNRSLRFAFGSSRDDRKDAWGGKSR
jgi:hypothetical protein